MVPNARVARGYRQQAENESHWRKRLAGQRQRRDKKVMHPRRDPCPLKALKADLLFWERPADNRVGNQHVKFSLARYAFDGLVVHRTSSQSYKDMNNLFLFAMLAVNRSF